jgi:hypothetical protein
MTDVAPVLGTIRGAAARLRIPMAVVGEWRHPEYGAVKLTQADLDALKANFARGSIGHRPFVRIGHDAPGKGTFGDAEAVGWVESVEQDGNVLYAVATPAGEGIVQKIRDGAFRYASMEYNRDYRPKQGRDAPVGAAFSAVSLTNKPFLTNLPEVQLQQLSEGDFTFALDYGAPTEEDAMPEMAEITAALAENNKSFLESLKATFSEMFKAPAPVVEPVKLSDAEATTKLAEAETKLAEANRMLAEAAAEQHRVRVETTIADLTKDGIPPAITGALKPLLLAARSTEADTVLLAEGGAETKVTQYDALVAVAKSTPDAMRVKFTAEAARESVDPPADAAVKLAERAKVEAEAYLLPGMKLVD